MSLIEAIVAASVLYLSAGILNNNLREEVQAPKRIHKSSSLVSTLITFGIILGVRLFLESISHYYFLDEFYLFRYLTTDLFLFAIMTTIFLPFHSVFFRKFSKTRFSVGVSNFQSDQFRSLYKKFIILAWIVGAIFLSFSLLQIPLESGDIFYLGFVWAIFVIGFAIIITRIVNMTRSIEARIPKIVLKRAMYTGGLISFGIWSIQLIGFEIYLRRAVDRIFFETSELIILRMITFVILFVIGIFSIGTYAKKSGWSESYLSASLISIAWLLLNLWLGTSLYLIIGDYVLVDILVTVLNTFIGAIMIKYLYDQEIFESLKISIIYNVILIFLAHIPTFLDANRSIPEQDIRILIVVVNTVYIVVYLITLKKIFKPKALERSEQKVQKALELHEKTQVEEIKLVENHVILDVQDLTTYFYTEEGIVKAVEGVSFKIHEGENLGLVGETGCGKSVTALSILQIVRPPGKIENGKVIFRGEDLLQKSESEILKHRGKDITMIFQDPLNSINPVFKIGAQITEVYLLHMENELLVQASKQDKSIFAVAREWGEQLLRDLNIPFPEVIFDRYPHELSGGMRQRVQIAMGLACQPKLLIADEPTTALDVTVQNQILTLMKELKNKFNTSMLFITHDLGIISKMCDRVAVMYSGFIVENGNIQKLFIKPYHPYTKSLISSVPVIGEKRRRLEVIEGTVPNLIYPPSGCRFHPRCKYCFEPCDSAIPRNIEVEPDYFVACHLYDPDYQELSEFSIKKAEEN